MGWTDTKAVILLIVISFVGGGLGGAVAATFVDSLGLEKEDGVIPEDALPNVLILSVDSLRADHMGYAGYDRPITPHIDALAARGTVFTQAYAQAPWTRPSVASTFTSLYPSVHRVGTAVTNVEGADLLPDEARSLVADSLAPHHPVLAEHFQNAGYWCGGWSENGHLWKGFGFDRGFDEYNGTTMTDDAIVERLQSLFREKSAAPFFVFAHLMAPHFPYEPTGEYRRFDRYPGERDLTPDLWFRIRDGKDAMNAREASHNLDLYDGEIWMTDTRIGEILTALQIEGLEENTIIVFMADHGEEFLDHGLMGHGPTVYEEVVHVPLILAGPDVPAGRVIDIPAQNLDLFPTLLTLAGLPPVAGLQGVDLISYFSPGGAPQARAAYAENAFLSAVVHDGWKLIHNSFTRENEVYKLARGAVEGDNRINSPTAQRKYQRLRQSLMAFHDRNAKRTNQNGYRTFIELDGETLARLEALGYTH